MQIAGEWFECSDRVVRPTVVADVCADDLRVAGVRFVVDTAADRSVLIAVLLPALPPLLPPPQDLRLAGVGGLAGFGMVRGALQFTRDDTGPITVRGEFAVFTDLGAVDMCVLGRDVTDLFDVIVSRRYGVVLLLGGRHRFAVSGT